MTVYAHGCDARALLRPGHIALARDWRAAHPRYSAENWQKNKELSKKVSKIAESNLVSAAQLSLKWLYQQAESLNVAMVAIPGTTKIAHAKSNIAAVDCADLTKLEMAQLAQLGDLVAGLRGDEAYLKSGIEGQGESSFELLGPASSSVPSCNPFLTRYISGALSEGKPTRTTLSAYSAIVAVALIGLNPNALKAVPVAYSSMSTSYASYHYALGSRLDWSAAVTGH
eukprot:6214695-Pleurochrysis_carterae.AAC.7